MLTIDEKRGIAYLPFGAPTFDRYGGDHKGANLFSDAVVAVDANTGKYLWHFQAIPSRHLGLRPGYAAGAAGSE